jgi:hypothetical protein
MNKHIARALAALAIAYLLTGTLWAQRPGARPPGQGNNNGGNNNNNGNAADNEDRDNKPKEVKLPEDPRLLQYHKSFVEAAEKLAAEYETAIPPKYDKAQACYEEVMRLIPQYPGIQEKLDAVKAKAAGKEKRTVSILANEDWQDTGVTVQLNKPVIITAEGEWKFKMNYDLDADGVEIPKELQDFNLGSLVGMIRTANPKNDKPFLVGARKEFTADKTGQLFLRMYDSDLTDNSGKLTVTITGTFLHKKVGGAPAAAN